jgi:phosphopantothenoylcysteine decarboxylase / phosphopantothenate---cysteine ligase
MGIALADTAVEFGAIVDLVLGPVNIAPRNNSINIINVTTAQSMAEECLSRFPSCDIAILAAAVSDYTPVEVSGEKLKKESADIFLKLKPTTDIAATLGQSKKPSQILAGFALETENELDNAKGKLLRKNLDIIILNSLREDGAGFGHDTNKITIIDRNNIIDKFELKSKEDAAADILEKIISLIR